GAHRHRRSQGLPAAQAPRPQRPAAATGSRARGHRRELARTAMTGPQQLATALEHLDATLPAAQYPLPLDGAADLRQLASALANQVRDYLLPRAAKLDAPLLAVVGGSTGAGKSTLVNAVLGKALTKPGVLRPTTKSPVLVCHPD